MVIEEFKQIYLNQPYGDIHLILRDASYNHHPYNWCPIGKEISIEKFNLDIVNQFYKTFIHQVTLYWWLLEILI